MENLGRYEIIKELGRGAMGIVYEAKDPLIDRLLAIKTIDLHNLAPQEKKDYEARFYQEARAAGRLSHPNIVTIHDLGESNGIAYIAMELLEGCELHHLIKDGQRLPVEQTLNIVAQVATGLAYAHEHGIVHRDIKPSNVMVLKGNQVKIADFGIARMESSLQLTQVGLIMGSPLYMSPEQILGGTIDPRSDIFSLGIQLFQMLTGQMPFSGDSTNVIMYQIVNVEPPMPSSINPEIPSMLDTIVSKCLSKNPEDRYPNAHELANDLRSCRETLLQIKAGISAATEQKMRKWKSVSIAAILFIIFEIIERLLQH